MDCRYNYLNEVTSLETLSNNEGYYILYEPQKIPDNANFCETDLQCLKAQFASGTNADLVQWDMDNPATWLGVSWTKVDGTYYVTAIDLANLGLEGNININGLSKLYNLNLNANKLTSIEVKDCPELKSISCIENLLDNLKITNCSAIEELFAYYNYIPQEKIEAIDEQMDELIGNNDIENYNIELLPQYQKGSKDDFDGDEVNAIAAINKDEEDAFSIHFDPENPGKWDNITWEMQDDGKYHISELNLGECCISGSVDLSSLSYLQSFDFHNTGVTEVVLPETLNTVTCRAFYECPLIESITVPESVASVEDLAFAGCKNLKEIKFKCSNAVLADNITYNSNQLAKVVCYKGTTEAEYIYGENVEVAYWQNDDIDPSEPQNPADPQNPQNPGKDPSVSANDPGKQDPGKEEPGKQDPGKQIPYEKVNKGDVITVGKAKYKVLKVNEKGGNVSYYKSLNKKAKAISIPTNIKYKGKTYSVTEISKNAFKNNKKIKNVTLGKKVQIIRKGAFDGCKNLKKITIKSKVLKKIEKYALRGTYKKIKIKVPFGKKKAYKKLLTIKSLKLSSKAKIY